MPGDRNPDPGCTHEKEISRGRQGRRQAKRRVVVRDVRDVVGIGEYEMEYSLEGEASEAGAEQKHRPDSPISPHHQSEPEYGKEIQDNRGNRRFPAVWIDRNRGVGHAM